MKKKLLFFISLILFCGISAQSNPNEDFDGDGIINSVDLDDDNDGIPDLLESPPSNTIVNGSFTSSTAPWVLGNGWVYNSGSGNVSITANNISNTDVRQTVNNLNRTDGIIALTMTLGAQDNSNAAGSTASLQIILNGTVYATVNNSTTRTVGTNNVTITLANGATTDFSPFSTANTTGYTTRTFTINIPYNSPASTDLIFRATVASDDWSIDNVSIPAYIEDTDGDGIPNYQDLDSDNDGCFDALEGDENVRSVNLSSNGSISGAVDGQGVPVLVNSGGAADIGGDQGQGIGDSKNATVSTVCADLDEDGIPSNIDLDNDNDGIPDCIEKGYPAPIISYFDLNGSATMISQSEARLTTTTNNQYGSMWSYGKIDFNKSFTIRVQANLGNIAGGADGIAIVFQNSAAGTNATGATGDGLGARGITSGVALELDTYANTSAPALDPSVTNGHGRIWRTSDQSNLTNNIDLGNLKDGAWRNVVITWNASTQNLSYTVARIDPSTGAIGVATQAGSYTFSNTGGIAQAIFGGASKAYFGFTASTGGAVNDQRIRFVDPCLDLPIEPDTDNDGIPNQLDLDSDNDGCFDSIEGDENVKLSQINTNGSISGAVDGQGVPVLVNSGGTADIGGDQGQGMGSSQNASANACLCYKPSVTSGTALNTNHGITALNRAGNAGANWPMVRKGAWTVLEAKTKGFVMNRLTAAQIAAIPPADLIEGMMVYNTTLDCLQINTTGTAAGWQCFNTQTCPDVN